nr:hypothetical protein GCM10020063_009880 [Dactylosporangium thailandense]
MPLTPSATGTVDPAAVWVKATTTAAMDFGRLTLTAGLVVYVFGTPGLQRFLLLRDELVPGASGGVVLADPARIGDCFTVVDCFEQRRLPYVVAVNAFDHGRIYTDAELRESLQIRDDVPLLHVDARRRHDVRDVLALLLQHALSARRTPAAVLTQP